MSQRNANDIKVTWKNRRVPSKKLAGLILSTAVVMCAVIMMVYTAPLGRNFQIGSIAPHDMTAPYDIVDEVTTKNLRQAARIIVDDIYVRDNSITQDYEQKASRIFDYMNQLPESAQRLRGQIIYVSERDSPLRQYENGLLTSDEWKTVLGASGTERLLQPVAQYMNEKELYALLTMQPTQYHAWIRELQSTHDQVLRKGVQENQINSARETFVINMRSLTPIYLDSVLVKLSDDLIGATMFFDEEATEEAAEEASRQIATQYITEGEPIVLRGEEITAETYELLVETGNILSWKDILKRWATTLLFYAILGVPLVYLLIQYMREARMDIRMHVLFVCIVGITLILSFFMRGWNVGFTALFFLILLITQLFTPTIAILSVLLVMPVTSVMSGGIGVFDYSLVAQSFFVSIISSLVGIVLVHRSRARASLILAGFCSGLAAGVVYLMIGVLRDQTMSNILMASLWSLLSAIFSAVIGLGLLPVLESLFDIATPMRLIELCDTQSPLMQRLMIEAPGTYHHSMMVAAMSEAAASAVGANVPLVRVAAYYHDIGKINHPEFFSENQMDGNVHDNLDPWESAEIIRAHVTDGGMMLKQEKFPSVVLNIVSEYHGTRAIGSFYAKAMKESGDPNLSDEPFRYPGPAPQSIESAILMIVDSLEASVRAMHLTDPKDISDMFDKIVTSIFKDKQLTNVSLSFEQIEKMRKAILYVMDGTGHKRVQYMDIDKLKEDLNGQKQD